MSSSPALECNPYVYLWFVWGRIVQPYQHLRPDEENIRLKLIFGLLCCYYCAFTWTLFDHVLTFHDEVMYVWKRPVRAGSILFYLIRYLGIVSLLAGITIYSWPEYIEIYPDPLLRYCRSAELDAVPPVGDAEHAMFWSIPGLQFFIFWFVEVILQTRIFALYGNLRLAIFNGALFTVEIAVMLRLWYQADPRLFRVGNPTSLSGVSTYSALYWLPGIVFELWLAALALRKLRPQVLKHDILSVIVNDSIRYFFLIAVVMVVHVIGTFTTFGIYIVPFVIAGQTIGGSRLVLHLRRAYFRGHDPEGSGPSITFAAGTTGIPVPMSRFADETFYVQDNLSDDEFMEEAI